MGMFNFVLNSFKGEIFDFKVERQGLIACTVHYQYQKYEQGDILCFSCDSVPVQQTDNLRKCRQTSKRKEKSHKIRSKLLLLV